MSQVYLLTYQLMRSWRVSATSTLFLCQASAKVPLLAPCQTHQAPILQCPGFIWYSEYKWFLFKAPVVYASNSTVLQQRQQLSSTPFLLANNQRPETLLLTTQTKQMFTFMTESQPYWPSSWLCQRGASMVQLLTSPTAGPAGIFLIPPTAWRSNMPWKGAWMHQPQRRDIHNTRPHLPFHK